MTAGERGETLALDYLRKQGYRLLDRNWRFGHRELDLVMLEGETVVFVEVKARSSTAFGTPGAFVDGEKRGNLIRAAEAYLVQKGLTEAFTRFDVVEVYLREGRIAHIPDAFTA